MRIRNAIATTALTIGALGITAGAASASTSEPTIDHNEHANTGDGINVVVSDILTNLDVLNNSPILNGSLNGLDVL